ncbi:MAG: transglycosylase family protein, partial [Chloroflexota bacterium]|nr:transglycosylase family protein [Chloroflexota bacterium]
MSKPVRGRHRKPRNRAHFAAMLIAPFIALTPFTVPPAQAATLSTWDRLARCESGGNWRINT